MGNDTVGSLAPFTFLFLGVGQFRIKLTHYRQQRLAIPATADDARALG